jgi:hypothetical protein
MNSKDYTIYGQGGGYKSLGFNIDILNNSNLAVPAGLLFLNNNFKKPQINYVKNGIVKSELYNTLKSLLNDKKLNINNINKKTKRKRRKKNYKSQKKIKIDKNNKSKKRRKKIKNKTKRR